MKGNMNIVGVIPARGKSKRLKNKNILKIKGKSLIGYTIEAALASKLIDKVVVSTDCEKIMELVERQYKVQVIRRPDELAKDDSPIEEALLHAVEYLDKKEGYRADIVVLMQANVPVRKVGVIDQAINKLIKSNADSCVTCRKVDQIPELMKIINHQDVLVPLIKGVAGIRHQEFPERYILDGAVDVIKAENLFNTRGIRKPHIFLGEKVIPLVQAENKYSLEIDTPGDLLLAKYYLEHSD